MLAADQLRRDSDGYLFDPEQWSEAVAESMAREADLDLTDEHWGILRFMRRVCELPDVRCTTFREATDYLDAHPELAGR